MKRIILVLLLIFSFIGLTGCSSYAVMKKYDNAEKYYTGSREYQGEVDTINITWVKGEVSLIVDESADKISVFEENDLSDKEKVHTYYQDNTLYVMFWQAGHRGTVEDYKKHVIITVPGFNELNATLTSADFEADALEGYRLNLNTSSGDINIKELAFNYIFINQVSGNLDCELVSGVEAKIDSTSGEVVIDKVDVDKMEVHTTSGDVKMETRIDANELKIDSTSGDIKLALRSLDKLNISATSSNINLELLDDLGMDIVFSSVSGDFNSSRSVTNSYDHSIFGDGHLQATVSTTSGDIYIK